MMLKMKDCKYPQHVPGLGLFEPEGDWVEVDDDAVKEFDKDWFKLNFETKKSPTPKKEDDDKGGES